ncbi:MAG: 16S rRNA (cytosine(967)-C(5))-methyltransferase RsmB [Actinobacteria bacterium]|nr:16S rRNA (cytosine(967)-C(5))-methyltransferase RsmB [Actinomycetota bacterium]
MSPARRAAQRVLVAIERDGVRFETALRREAARAGLDGRDAALLWELASGVTKRRRSLDVVIAALSRYPLRSMPAEVRTALRLGVYQLLFLDRIPVHAAVGESVELVRGSGAGSAGLVNAVLRRASDEVGALFERAAGAAGTEGLSVRSSYPPWLIDTLVAEWGDDVAQALLAQGNEVPERCLRVNTLLASAPEATAALRQDGITVAAPPAPSSPAGRCAWPQALVYEGPALERSRAFRKGWVTPQSRAAQLVSVAAAGGVPAGAAVADLCAAPGAKTTHLAALLSPRRLLAVDADPQRAGQLRATLERMRVGGAEVVVGDSTRLPDHLDGSFDVVLVDAPCSGLGTLAARPDLRWRRRPGDAERLAESQQALLSRAVRLARPGGRVTYSVCTMTRRETVDVVSAVARDTDVELDDLGAMFPALRDRRLGAALLTLPPRDGTSGFFVASLTRR